MRVGVIGKKIPEIKNLSCTALLEEPKLSELVESEHGHETHGAKVEKITVIADPEDSSFAEEIVLSFFFIRMKYPTKTPAVDPKTIRTDNKMYNHNISFGLHIFLRVFENSRFIILFLKELVNPITPLFTYIIKVITLLKIIF